jgi:hypothetical protein
MFSAIDALRLVDLIQDLGTNDVLRSLSYTASLRQYYISREPKYKCKAHLVQKTPSRGAVREHAHRTRTRFYRSRLQDTMLCGWQEECRAPAGKVVVEVDEERQA